VSVFYFLKKLKFFYRVYFIHTILDNYIIDIRGQLITYSLIQEHLQNQDYESAMIAVNEKLKRLSDQHTDVKINAPEMLVPTH
jgi:hypothetical protein